MRVGVAWLTGAILFTVVVGAGLHGFSIPVWHRFIDGSAETEVILGQARLLRWDDTSVHIPMALSQRAQDPKFPMVNRDIGLGQNMLVPTGASLAYPVAHPLTLFRPTLWGWFMGDDAGVAWMWWIRVALGIVPLAWAAMLLGATPGLAAAGAALFAAGPGLQVYSWNGAPYVGFAALAFGACIRLATTQRPRALAGWALLLGWAGGCFLVALYPPFQVTVGWTFAALLAAWAAERFRVGDLQLNRSQCAALAAGAGLTLAVGVLFVSAAGDTLEVLRNTHYPGARVSTGGDVSFWVPFSADLFAMSRHLPNGQIVRLAGSFTLLFPITAYAALRGPTPRDRVALVLAIVCALLFVYEVLGIPALLARASLLSFAPGERCFLALGAADILLLLRVVSAGPAPADRWRPAIVGGWMLLLAVAAVGLHRAPPDVSPLLLIGAIVFHGAFGWAVLAGRAAVRGVAALAAVAALSTLWFNPLVRGGTEFMRENVLARRIRAIDAQSGGESMWASYAPFAIGNLFRIVGVRALSGVHGIPQLELWERIDPERHYLKTYNRYAHILLGFPEARRPPLRNPSYDALRAGFAPDGDELLRLGVTHLLVNFADRRMTKGFSRWQPDERVGSYAIYALPLHEAADP